MDDTPNTSPVQLEVLIKLASLKLTGAYGGVLRDDNRRVKILFSGPLGMLETIDAELEAIKVALELVSLADWKDYVRMLLESDSQTTVSFCHNPASRKLREVLVSISSVQFCYIPREMNCWADALAKTCVDRTSMFKVCW
ncbi:hypothetical protein GOBAR_AA09041 [Gossypium barbadense]|uniref:RNase H type-1 domain-containing protein n=1 Tax=Gossypium barbadense TaxID=3634 RepID=A0A2P5Y7Q0_GOSBA|nr:hypothetical protein GOBAR_AA09041 [Gossypium barbadense]